MATNGAAADASACGNCSAPMQGRFCYDCGARPFTADEYSIRRFVRSAFHEITDLDDSKLYRTMHALFVKPGLLSQEYFSARRVRYVKPLALLLAIFALHLFAYSVSNTVNLFSIDASMSASPFEGTKNQLGPILDKVAVRKGITVEELKNNINEQWTANFSWSQLPQVLVFALLLKLIFLTRRRRFVEHLVFAAHFYAFQLLTVTLMWPLYFFLGMKVSATGLAIAAVKYVIDVTYIYLAARRFYGTRGWKGVVRAVAIFFAYMLVYLSAYSIANFTAMMSEAPARAAKAPPPNSAAAAARFQREITREGGSAGRARE